MDFETVYGCLFCDKIHGTEMTICQHLDAHLDEFRGARPVPTFEAQQQHPKAIIRAVRSLRKRGGKGRRRMIPPVPEGAELRDECSLWKLVVALTSSAAQRAHRRLDRTELTTEWWKRFVDAGLKPGVGSDPRVGTGWAEHLEREARTMRYRALALRRAAEQEAVRRANAEKQQLLAEDEQRLAQHAQWNHEDWEEYSDDVDDENEYQDINGSDEEDGEQDNIPEKAGAGEKLADLEQENVEAGAGEKQIDQGPEVHRVCQHAPSSPLHSPEPPSLTAAEKGKGKAIPTTTASHESHPPHPRDDEFHYRDRPSSSASGPTNNIISSKDKHGNGFADLAGNNGPITFHQDASIMSRRGPTIILPETPKRTRKRVANSPLPNPRSNNATPRAGKSAVDITLRLTDNNATVKVRSRDTLQSGLAKLQATIDPGIRYALSGITGAGTRPAWARVEISDWDSQWCERVWEVVKVRGGSQIPVPEVGVHAVWKFE